MSNSIAQPTATEGTIDYQVETSAIALGALANEGDWVVSVACFRAGRRAEDIVQHLDVSREEQNRLANDVFWGTFLRAYDI